MKPKRKLLIAVVLLFALFLLVSVFLPSEVIIEREKNIRADKAALFNMVNDFGNWDKWNPWHKMDKDWTVTYSDPSAGLAASYKWQSGNSTLGNGKATIVDVVGTDSVFVEMDIEKRGLSLTSFHFRQKDSVVNVKWKMNAKTGFFGRIFPGLFMKDKLETLLDEGLNALDSLSRSGAILPAEGIAGISAFERSNVLYLKDSCNEHDIAFVISKLYAKIQAAMAPGSKINGAPLCIYHNNSESKVVFSAAIPLSEIPSSLSTENIKAIKLLKLDKAIVYNYYGSVSDIKNAYGIIAAFMEEKSLKQDGESIEEYVSDTGKETDPKKWLTRIYVPVE